MMGSRKALQLILLAAMSLSPVGAQAALAPDEKPFGPNRFRVEAAAETPFTTIRGHHIGNLAFSVTNYGFFGSQSRGLRDACTGRAAPSMEFPANSGGEYLFQGALWGGAVK